MIRSQSAVPGGTGVVERVRSVRFASSFAGVVLALAIAAPAARAKGGDDPRTERFNAAVAKILSRKELDGATVGIELRSLTRDARVGSRNVNRAFAPASNLKLVTLYLSLQILGPEWNFQTQLVAGGPIVEGGRLEGDLWVRGGGDPTLQPAFFETEDENAPLVPFVEAAQLAGVRHVKGDLVVDDRLFDRQFIPDGWPQNQLEEEYAAPVAALSLGGNCLHVRVTTHAGQSPTAELRPPVFGWRLLTDLAPANGSQFQVGIVPPDAQGTLRIRGSVGNEVGVATAKLPVADPPLFFGNAYRAALERAGVIVAGAVRRAAPDEQPDAKARTLFTRRSPLLPALQRCGKESDNTIAEHLLKCCAAVRFGVGTDEHGSELVAALCKELGVDGANVKVVDGSGLSHLDSVTPAFLGALLVKAYAAPWRDDYVRCLPISGVDGTLEKRMSDPAMVYRVRAKTGFINQVSALSGFALAGDIGGAAGGGVPGGGEKVGGKGAGEKGGEKGASKAAASERAFTDGGADREVFAFSILINGFKGANAEMKRVQDDLCRAIVALPRVEGK